MSPANISAMSTGDCDILYEKITSSNQCDTQSSIDGNRAQSNTIHCSGKLDENHNCACELMGSEYPNYAADELSFFHKLQSGVMPSSADMKTSLNESIDLEIEILGDDSPVNYPDPGKDSESMECEILWAKCADSSSKPSEDQSAKELDATKDSEVLHEEMAPKNCDPPESLEKNMDLDSISLSKRLCDISSFVEETNADVEKNKKTTTSAHSCDICKMSLSTVYALKVHLLDHVNDTKTNAVIYQKSLAALLQLDFRIRTNRSGSKKLYNCEICSEVLLTYADLRWHRNISHLSQDRPFQCKLCYKNYTRKGHLLRHESTHRKKRK